MCAFVCVYEIKDMYNALNVSLDVETTRHKLQNAMKWEHVRL